MVLDHLPADREPKAGSWRCIALSLERLENPLAIVVGAALVMVDDFDRLPGRTRTITVSPSGSARHAFSMRFTTTRSMA
ncbi:hypothetical protein [Methylosinus sporium]|uniref:hypothetical protein n=1 Tax=Methylosinus sporium TaxID=428 RepID=UPI00383A416B